MQRVACNPVARCIGARGAGTSVGFARGATAHSVHDVVTIKDTNHGVDTRCPLQHLGAVALHKAASHDDALHSASAFTFECFLNDFQTFVLGRFQKSTGVDDDGVGCIVVGDQLDAASGQDAEHLLAVNKVLRAAEADECDGANGVIGSGHRRGDSRQFRSGREVCQHGAPFPVAVWDVMRVVEGAEAGEGAF